LSQRISRHSPLPSCRTFSPLFQGHTRDEDEDCCHRRSINNYQTSHERPVPQSKFSLFLRRFNTIEASGLKNVHTAGGGRISGLVQKVKSLPQDVKNLKNLTWKDVKPVKRIKSLHGPITYVVLLVMFAQKYKWPWRNPAWWFAIAFCVKWFRARYVFKIPVWDRQPNWNNVITSKEQEKDLKAFTCKTCGSTIFIAKTREFFFEGSTGIGGLGCFSCGAKGPDNFVMDRDRIVEDVADMDDYFEYERPLDFISRAERRELMKEAGGDEEKANQILVERNNAQASEESQAQAEAIVNGGKAESVAETDVVAEEEEDTATSDEPEETFTIDDEQKSGSSEDEDESEQNSPEKSIEVEAAKVEKEVEMKSEESSEEPTVEKKVEKKTVKPSTAASKQSSPSSSEDDLDLLGMDEF